MKLYTCNYCFKEFEPTRRRVQRYCSNTCRSKAHHARKSNNKEILNNNSLKETQNKPNKTKLDSISSSGIGNATIGTLIADGLKSIAISNKNKPATKNDIEELKNILTSRYLPINNVPNDFYGNKPYYDVETKSLVYLKI